MRLGAGDSRRFLRRGGSAVVGQVVGDSKERDDANWSHEDARQWLLRVCNGIRLRDKGFVL